MTEAKIYASFENNITYFQVPWADGFLIVQDNYIKYSCSARDGIIGPRYMKFVNDYNLAFNQLHAWEHKLGGSVLSRYCKVCESNFTDDIAGLCDMQIFHKALIKFSRILKKQSSHSNAWTIDISHLPMSSSIVDKISGYIALHFVMKL